MSAERPVNVADMIAWLRAHPGESFFSLWSKDRLLIGTRSDTGEICAWDCNVQASKMEYDRRASPAPETRTAAAEIDALTQRWTAQVEHLKAGIVALANSWESRTHRGNGAGKRATYRICSREMLAEWDRLCLEDARNHMPRAPETRTTEEAGTHSSNEEG